MRKYISMFIISMLVVLVACSSDGSNKEDKAIENMKTNTMSENKERLTLENDGVDESSFSEVMEQFSGDVPERMITTSVPLAEIMHYFEMIPVGVPSSNNPLPADFQSIEQIGSPMEPNLEIMTDLEPDIILSAESLQSTLEESLQGKGLLTAYLPTDSLDDLKLSMKALGTYFDQTELMNEKMQSIIDKENELAKQAVETEVPSVMLLVGTAESFMVMNSDSYLGSLIDRVGADNIATSVFEVKDTYSAINMEEVIAADPDVIFVLTSGDHGAAEDMFKTTIENDETWKQLSAYTNDQIHMLENEIFGVTSIQHVEQALTEIGNILLK